MKHTAFLLILISSCSLACPKLEGKWHSSAALTNKFNDERAIIDEKTREFRAQLVGKSTVEYRKGEVSMTMPPSNKIIIQGKTYPWDSSQMRSKYSLLGCTKNSVMIKYEAFGSSSIYKLNFESADIYWVYDGQAGGNGNDHTREYFTRVK